MKTSDEIKEYIKQRLKEEDYFSIYFELFDELKDVNGAQEMKAINYRWMAACSELHKKEGYTMIDETFARSLICYNTMSNFKKKNMSQSTLRRLKLMTGWNIDTIANGKHCELAQIIINTIESYV